MAPKNPEKIDQVVKEDNGRNPEHLGPIKDIAYPPPGEEVVITGMAGRFPDSNDVAQYLNNLLNKRNLITFDNARWNPINAEVPHGTGKIRGIEKFDAGFFGVHFRQAHSTDPMCRLIVERAFEAITDAGLNLSQMRGCETGVFVGACFSESEKTWFYDRLESPNFGFVGCERSMLANRISYCLGLKGPSYVIDTACSGSMHALEHAYRAIRAGRCDNAIVGGVSLCLHPAMSLQFARLGMLSKKSSCRSFDRDADGYTRSEACVVVFLQKAKNAKRIYAQVVHAKSNCDGYKEQGITFPSGPMQNRLVTEIYEECGVPPETVDFLEAHATGTRVGDPEELNAMDAVFCKNRERPLLIGAIKSNLGHTEPGSGLCSIVKVIMGMEMDIILPNINYENPREGVEALEKGRMVVVTDTTPWPESGSGLAAVNSFGFGGSNCHVVLKRFTKRKVNEGLPTDDLPRLVCVSGRTEYAVNFILDDIGRRTLDMEFVRLLHNIFQNNTNGHPVRGYILQAKRGEICRSMKRYDESNKPLCLAFSGPDRNWFNVASQLFHIPPFAASVQKIHAILVPKGINITDIISNKNELTNGMVNVIVGNVAIQVALVDTLKALEIEYDYVMGYSVGELVAAYADGSLTLGQTVLASYCIAQCYRDLKNVVTTTYRVELHKHQTLEILDSQVEVIGHNSEKCYTISGPTKAVIQYISGLKNKGINVEEVPDGSGLHSKYSLQIRSTLLQRLKQVMSEPKQRSPKWITSSVNKEQFKSEVAKYASGEYFINNLFSPVLYYEATLLLPSDAVVVEIGSWINNSHSNHDTITLIPNDPNNEDNINTFLCGLGRLYEVGLNPKLEKLYPAVEFPVSVGTPAISPLVKWNHDSDWFVVDHKKNEEKLNMKFRRLAFSIKHPALSYISGHVIDERNLIPATYYLLMVWDTVSMMRGTPLDSTRIVFEDIRFLRATNISKNDELDFIITIQKQSGMFEISELGNSVVTGRVYVPEECSTEIVELPTIPRNGNQIRYSTKDAYTELKLRGYKYTGAFQAIKECDLSGTRALVEWTGNWVTFMDNIFQVSLLQEDTRKLYVPTGIERLAIDPKAHLEYVATFGENPAVPVYTYKEMSLMKSGGIEIRGSHISSIPRRKQPRDPLQLSYKFIPLDTRASLNQAVSINIQISIENEYTLKYRAIEVIDDVTAPEPKSLSPIIYQTLDNFPLLQSDIVVYSREPLELQHVTVENKNLDGESNTCNIVTASNILGRPELAEKIETALKENGLAISREDLNLDVNDAQRNLKNMVVVAVQETETEKLVLLSKPTKFKASLVLDLTRCHEEFDWLPILQQIGRKDEIILFAQGDPLNGILGLYECFKLETGNFNIKCFFIMDQGAPKFDINHEFYARQLRKRMPLNVLKGGEWGIYGCHELEKENIVQCEHIYNNVMARGDFSSLRWFEGPLGSSTALLAEEILVYIYYAALNFRDVMTASGRINTDIIARERMEQLNVQGLEFAGRDVTGKRVIGMVTHGGLGSMVISDQYLAWEVPDGWTMEEAATIPVAYSTVVCAFIMTAHLKPGQSILIHSGTGAVGQAAIYVALYYNCEIFTTVGTNEKRQWIREKFPQIPESRIGNSRDTSFEQMIMRETKGRGVDIVLNSLSDEKLLASVRCLAAHGKFLEIGKFDLVANHLLGLGNFTDGRSFHGIMLNAFFNMPADIKRPFYDFITEGMKTGCVRPLSRVVFKEDEVEQAFRFMFAGKHIGKVLVKVRDEEPQTLIPPAAKMFNGLSRFYCNPDSCYVICGGLGGFGLELADWMVLRGAKKLVLSSRQGVKTGYQASRIRIWNTYGVATVVSTADITTKEGCIELINDSHKLGPIEAVFNLAAVIRDAILENQTAENFKEVLAPKAIATRHLDSLTREMCPALKHFVVFSSATSRLGNPGQTNYTLANSIIERICERRKNDGYPALAIQWGPIGEVGLLMDSETEIGGTLKQNISSCLNELDTFLRQNETVVSSMVIGEKRGKSTDSNSMIHAVKTILGISDLKTISLHATFSELGMDSMMAVDIKQTLEREHGQFLAAQEIRNMTFAKLQDTVQENGFKSDATEEDEIKVPSIFSLVLPPVMNEQVVKVEMERLPSLVKPEDDAPDVFLLPSIEGFPVAIESLAINLACHALFLQYPFKEGLETSVEALAEVLLPHIERKAPTLDPFTIVGYSYGSLVGLQLAAMLEERGRTGRLILIDGAPEMSKDVTSRYVPKIEDDQKFHIYLLCAVLQFYAPSSIVLMCRNELLKCKSYEERLNTALKFSPKIRSILTYEPSFRKLKSTVHLIKPNDRTIENYDEDYKLQELCEKAVEVSTFDGSHVTILQNPEVALKINQIIEKSQL